MPHPHHSLGPRWAGLALLLGLTAACGRSSRIGHPAPDVPGAGSGSEGASGGRSGSGGSAAGGSAATGGDSGTDSGGAGSPDPAELSSIVLDGTPLYTRVSRLTVSQWEHAVTDILRFPQPGDLSRGFLRPVSGTTDFDNNEKLLYVDTTNFLDFETGAEAAAALATGSDAALAALFDGNDAPGFVRTLGRRAFRRPLTEAEGTAYAAIFARGEELYGVGFANGAALVIRAMLQSPHFLYRTELGPAADALNGYELASKLSFLLLDTTPSDALLDAAAAGELDDDDGLEAAARQMLDAPAALAVLRNFHRQLYALDDYASLDKSGVPDFNVAILPELEAVSTAFFDRIFEADLGLREILTSKDAYVGVGLAPFYGVTPPASGVELRGLGASRSGYFMQVPFLMRWADGDRSDPIQRGLRLERMLCGPLHAAGDTTPATLGVALERFDGLGREREEDNGNPVNTASSYPFAEGVQQFGDGNDLLRIMASSVQVHTCYSKNVSGYALGRDMAPGDRPLLEGLGQVSLSHSLRELVLALVREPAFRSRPEAAP